MKKSLKFLNKMLFVSILFMPNTLESNINNRPRNAINKGATNAYISENFTQVPDDWELYNRCDKNNVETTASEGELVVSHNQNSGNASSITYYGAMYLIDTAHTYENFTFEMEFKVTSYLSESRWFGIMYHVNNVDTQAIGYMMNYRINGESANSAICVNSSGQTTFNDGVKQNKGIKLVEPNYHTLKITMVDNMVSHFMDDTLIEEYDINSKSEFINDPLYSGNFALIVNKMTLNVKSVKITSDSASEVVQTDMTIHQTYKNKKVVSNFPTVVTEINSKTELDNLKGDIRPSNAIIHIDDACNVVNESKEIIDSFDNVYKRYLKGKIIPIVYVEDTNQANALVEFLNNKIDILDMAVMSNKPELVKLVRELKYKIRGIIEFDDECVFKDIVKTANMHYASTVVISENIATIENVTYLQARFKTVWVKAILETQFNFCKMIDCGAYGIIASNFKMLYDTFELYKTNSLTRMPFNVAHRGLPKQYNENSVTGTKAAIENGATHVELDCYLTTDEQVVMMHNKTIDATTNGTGDIESFSLEELRQYKLDVREEEEIPTLEDILKVMKKTNAVLILEVKSSNPNIIPAIRRILLQYNFFDQVVFISFNADILSLMKSTIPEVPSADLQANHINNFVETLTKMGRLNTGVDTANAYSNKDYNEQYLRDRGIIGWYWTYDTASEIYSGLTEGYVGLTNNSADSLKDEIRFVKGTEIDLIEGQNIDNLQELELDAETYQGNTIKVIANLFRYQSFDTYYEAIYAYTSKGIANEFTIYSEPIKINKFIEDKKPDNNPVLPPDNENVDNQTNVVSAMNIVSYCMFAVSIGVIIFEIVRYIKKHKRA